MANTIVFVKNFDSSKISFNEVKKNSMGGNVVYLNYANKQKLILQTPEIYAPFGISSFIDEKTNTEPKYSVDISFRGTDEDVRVAMFYEKMKELDETLITSGTEKSKEWFGKKHSKEIMENFYRPLVKPAKNERYAPTMKLKIRNLNEINCFDINQNKLEIQEALKPGVKLQAIIEIGSVWFINKTMYGMSWNLIQLKVFPTNKIQGYSFINDSDEEEEEL